VLFEHKEAEHEVKTRPAVVLLVLGDRVVLVYGQSRAPIRDSVLEVGPKTDVRDRGAGFDNTTYFGSRSVLVVHADRIVRRIGKLSFKRFMDLDALTVERRTHLAERARAEANVQRTHLRRRIEDRVRDDHVRLQEIADEARLSRARLQQILQEDGFWTRQELHALARVLGVSPEVLLGEREDPVP